MARRLAGLRSFLRRFSHCRRGNVAMMFALALPLLTMTSLVGVDVHRISTVRANLQDALDAAALAAARSPHMDEANITTVGMAALRANLQAYPQIALREDLTRFRLTEDGAVVADSKVDVETLVANIFLPPYGRLLDDQVQVGVESEVLRSSTNLEVALVLDITGSMAGDKITDLQDAADELIDLVVQDQQTPYYSKASIVPYSMGVNVGSWAAQARGAVPLAAGVTAAGWADGSGKSISGATRDDPVRITATNHGFANGDRVYISGVRGMTEVNGRVFTVANRAANTFTLRNVDGDDYDRYDGGGTVTRCRTSDCSVVFTANSHGFASGDRVRMTGLVGLEPYDWRAANINNANHTVSERTTNTFVLSGLFGPAYSAYSRGGQGWCLTQGCQYFEFTSAWGQTRTHEISTCVSERTGTEAYTDAAPSTALVGRNYPSGGNACPSNSILPLTSNKTALHDAIEDLIIGGSTAGHIGLAWGWYTVSPNFSELWTGNSTPAPYGSRHLLKVVVLMTDGEFNTIYCNGVISGSSTSGSGSQNDQINCPAPNGDAFNQAEDLCDAMKAQDIVIYTVGFALPDSENVRDVMANCATDPSHVFLPETGADLREAFRAIARSISDLRIAR